MSYRPRIDLIDFMVENLQVTPARRNSLASLENL
jgi:hypothetical protein